MKKYLVFLFFQKAGCVKNGPTVLKTVELKLEAVGAESAEQAIAWVQANGCCCPPLTITNPGFVEFGGPESVEVECKAYLWGEDILARDDLLVVDAKDPFADAISRLSLDLVYDLLGEDDLMYEYHNRQLARSKATQ